MSSVNFNNYDSYFQSARELDITLAVPVVPSGYGGAVDYSLPFKGYGVGGGHHYVDYTIPLVDFGEGGLNTSMLVCAVQLQARYIGSQVWVPLMNFDTKSLVTLFPETVNNNSVSSIQTRNLFLSHTSYHSNFKFFGNIVVPKAVNGTGKLMDFRLPMMDVFSFFRIRVLALRQSVELGSQTTGVVNDNVYSLTYKHK